jgi:hypothetical protein
MTLTLERSKAEDGPFEWSDAPKLPLERQLGAIARRMLEWAEKRLRSHAQYQYEWALERQADLRREIQEEQQAAERKRLAATSRTSSAFGIACTAWQPTCAKPVRFASWWP